MGPLAFLAVAIAAFQVIFSLGAPLHVVVQDLFVNSERLLTSLMPESLFRSVLIEGVWRGVGSVLAFLPQILLLFLFIGLLEDSGYLARAAVIADRTMARVGLQGKSFIPLLSAYSCAVPAIMATRTIENKRDRIATILIAPFMTCSARLPAYSLIILAFIPARTLLGPLLGIQTAAMLGLYVLGFLAAVATAKLLKSTILKSSPTPFLMEMPSYRWPSLRSLGLRVLDRGVVFVKQAGSIILIVTVILAVLLNFPYANGKPPEIEHSIAGTIGHGIEPLIKPLGLNWKVGIGLITSLVARETMPATLGTIYGAERQPDFPTLQAALHHDLTLGGAIALLVFFAFALQCMSTVAIVRRETASWKWPLAQFAYMGALAWIGAFAAFHLIG
jgi:ferrous iron transport protein B